MALAFSVTPSHGTNDVIVIKDAFKSCIEFLDRLISTKHFRAERAPKCVLISIKDFFLSLFSFFVIKKNPFGGCCDFCPDVIPHSRLLRARIKNIIILSRALVRRFECHTAQNRGSYLNNGPLGQG